MIKTLVSGLFVGGLVGGAVTVVSEGMKNIDKEEKSFEVRAVREHSTELFDAFCGLNNTCKNTEEKKAFRDLRKTLNRLLTLERYIERVPKQRFWSTRAIDYKYQIRMQIMFLKRLHPDKETEEYFSTIREAASNACHNVRLANEIKFENL